MGFSDDDIPGLDLSSDLTKTDAVS